MAKPLHNTPNLDELESGPWPSYITGLKKLAKDNDLVVDLLGQLEESYATRTGYWKGGTVGVIGYGGGVIPRFTELMDENGDPKFKDAAEFHTLRIMPPAGLHYDTDTLRMFCDVWEKHGSGIICAHGQSGDLMLQGCTTEKVQPVFDELNEKGWDMGGAGPAVRTAMSCVGAARCEQSCFNEAKAHRMLINEFLDDMHRPALPYKMKFKVSGCSNDCTNAIQRSDFAVIGTWRDDIKVNQDGWKKMVDDRGIKYVVDNIISRCPSNCMSLNDDSSLEIQNSDCVKCMHCLNVTTAMSEKYVGKEGDPILAQGDDKGVSVLIGGKRTLKIGDMFGSVIVPFMKLESEEDYERLLEIAGETIDFFAENALEHERTGEMIERIGLVNFLEGIDIEIDPNMISQPRTNPYVRMDGWDDEVAKWEERKAA